MAAMFNNIGIGYLKSAERVDHKGSHHKKKALQLYVVTDVACATSNL